MEIINGYPAKYWRRLDRWYLRIAAALIAAFVLLCVADWLQDDGIALPSVASAPIGEPIGAAIGTPNSEQNNASGRLESTVALTAPDPSVAAQSAAAVSSAISPLATAASEPAAPATKPFEARWSGGKLHFNGHVKDYRQAELVRQQAGAAVGFSNVSDGFEINSANESEVWQAHILPLASWFRGKPDGAFFWQGNTIVLSGTVKTPAERTARAEWVRSTFGTNVQLKNDITLVGQAPAPVSAAVSAPVSAPISLTASAPLPTVVAVAAPAVPAPAPAPIVAASTSPVATIKAAVSSPVVVAPTPAPFAEAEVQAALQAWRSAWAASDVATYTNSYTADFKGDLASNAAWRAQRQQRIAAAGKITVELSHVKLARSATSTPTLERAQAVFVQNYSSATLRQRGEKTLLLVKQNGRWLIEKESFRAL